MIVATTTSHSLSAQLPSLVQTASLRVNPAVFAEGTANLFTQAQDLSLSPHLYRGAATTCEFQGLLSGLQVNADDMRHSLEPSWLSLLRENEAPLPSVDAMVRSAEAFLFGIRSGLVGNLGQITDEARPFADDFLKGAMEVFPNWPWPTPPPFLRSVSRAWGRFAAEKEVSGEPDRGQRSLNMGKACAEILKDQYEIGLAGGLSGARLLSSVHVRDAPAFLRARGWLMGVVEVLCRKDDIALEEAIQALENNRASIVSYALNHGDLSYVKETVAAVAPPGSFFLGFAAAVGQIGINDPATARALKNRRNMVVSKLLHQGSLRVTPETLVNLKGWRR